LHLPNIQITLFCASNYLINLFACIKETSNDMITNVVFNPSHIVFASSTNNNMEGESIKTTKHATKEHIVLEM
jgi:hypothetical protein